MFSSAFPRKIGHVVSVKVAEGVQLNNLTFRCQFEQYYMYYPKYWALCKISNVCYFLWPYLSFQMSDLHRLKSYLNSLSTKMRKGICIHIMRKPLEEKIKKPSPLSTQLPYPWVP